MDWMGAFVELSNKLTLGEKVLEMADLLLALPNPGRLEHQGAGAWLVECPCQPGLIESQNGSGSKGPQGGIWSKLPAQQGCPRRHGTGLCPDSSSASPARETLYPLWTICSSVTHTVKFFLFFQWNFQRITATPCLLLRVLLPGATGKSLVLSFGTPPSHIYIHQ